MSTAWARPDGDTVDRSPVYSAVYALLLASRVAVSGVRRQLADPVLVNWPPVV